MSSIRVGEMIKRWRGNKRRSAIKLARIRRPHTRARPSISTIVPPPPPSPPVSTRRPFVCIFKLNRLYAAIPQFYAASSCPHYRVKPVREIQSATISTTGEICNESPKQWRRQSKLAERGSGKGDIIRFLEMGRERRDSCFEFARILYLKREKMYREGRIAKRTEKTI